MKQDIFFSFLFHKTSAKLYSLVDVSCVHSAFIIILPENLNLNFTHLKHIYSYYFRNRKESTVLLNNYYRIDLLFFFFNYFIVSLVVLVEALDFFFFVFNHVIYFLCLEIGTGIYIYIYDFCGRRKTTWFC